MNLMITPVKDLVIIPSFRLEYDDSDLNDNYTRTAAPTRALPDGETPEVAHTNNWTMSAAEGLEARYTGFRDWSLYATADWGQDWGNNSWNTKPVLNEDFNQDWNRLAQKYAVGANWYPLSGLNFGGQYYHQIHDYDYTNRLANIKIDYPGVIQAQYFTTDDFNVRATWQALSNVSMVTRYDFQYSTVDTTAFPALAHSPRFPGRAGRELQHQQPHHQRKHYLVAPGLSDLRRWWQLRPQYREHPRVRFGRCRSGRVGRHE